MEHTTHYQKAFYMRGEVKLPATPVNIVCLSNNKCAILNLQDCLILDFASRQFQKLDLKQKQITPTKHLFPHSNGGFCLQNGNYFWLVDKDLNVKAVNTFEGYVMHGQTWVIHQKGEIFTDYFDTLVQRAKGSNVNDINSPTVYREIGQLTADSEYEISQVGRNLDLQSISNPKVRLTLPLPRQYSTALPFQLNPANSIQRVNIWVLQNKRVIIGELDHQQCHFTIYLVDSAENLQTNIGKFQKVNSALFNSVNEHISLMMLTLGMVGSDDNKLVIYDYKNRSILLEVKSVAQLSKHRAEYQLSPDFQHYVQLKTKPKSSSSEVKQFYENLLKGPIAQKKKQGEVGGQGAAKTGNECTLVHYQRVQKRRVLFHLYKQSFVEEAFGEGLIRRVLRVLLQ